MRVVLTGGGTGGHTTPLIAVADVLRRTQPELELFFEGALTPSVKTLLAAYDIPAHHIPSGKLRRYASLITISDLLILLPLGILLALCRMWWLMPDVVISKSGYGSVPTVIAAWFYRIPILIHESDVVPGLASAKLAPLATIIAVGFAESRERFGKQKRKVVVTGTPIRLDFVVHDQRAAKESFGFTGEDIVIVITGGSQGAQQINEATLKILPQLITDAKIIHLTGPDHFDAVSTVAHQLLEQSAYKEAYKVFPSLKEEMPLALAAADIVVSRAGATTLAEIARLKKASLLIPLPGAAQDNQRQNATVFERAGAARVLDANNLGSHLFHRALEELVASADLRTELARAVAAFDHPDAARDMATLATRLAEGLVPTYTR